MAGRPNRAGTLPSPNRPRHADRLAAARAFYEFYYAKAQADDARVSQFTSGWNPTQTTLYRSYMSGGKPANKRLFHLVFERPRHAGGTGQHELKNQIDFAVDLKEITESFSSHADSDFQQLVRGALQTGIFGDRQNGDVLCLGRHGPPSQIPLLSTLACSARISMVQTAVAARKQGYDCRAIERQLS